MHERYWLFPRNGIYYIEDQTTGKQSNSTNKYLRIVHNRAMDLGWRVSPVLAWKVRPKERTNL